MKSRLHRSNISRVSHRHRFEFTKPKKCHGNMMPTWVKQYLRLNSLKS